MVVLKPLTLSGRYFSKKDISEIQQTVTAFPALSMTELALTVCEHLNWKTANGRNKINACFTALEKLESLDYIKLPKKAKKKARQTKPIAHSKLTEPQENIDCTIEALGTIECQLVTEKHQVARWNEYVDRYHYLKYKQPIGCHLKYFIVSKQQGKQTLLGCLLFSSASWHLTDRDQWIGWNEQDRKLRLNRVINNTRFLIFPWVKVPNLASKALSIVVGNIQSDWHITHNYQPVLIETFVDDSRYSGTCYQASNWQRLGKTSGKNWQDTDNNNRSGTIKSIFVFPLQSNFRDVLKNKKTTRRPMKTDESFILLWGKVVHIIADIAQEFDKTWQKRKRVIDTLLLVFLIFRLVFSKNHQGYGTTIEDFWANCHRMKFALPQKKPISAAAFTEARKKLNEKIFKHLNNRIIKTFQKEYDSTYRWLSHRLFAVDGSKLNLPRPLITQGYKTPLEKAHYPQGLLSCLYQLKSKVPYDFDLVKHRNERQCALAHLKVLKKNDVVVYDRGYFSYAVLYYHVIAGIHPIFRLQKSLCKEIDDFRSGNSNDEIIQLAPSLKTQKEILIQHPTAKIETMRLRLIKYEIEGETYCLGTTLMSPTYTLEDFKSVYHARWGIEELYKVSKNMIDVGDFHGRSERTVKQELFAHFVLITMSRLCANESENLLTNFFQPMDRGKINYGKLQVNFKNTLSTLSRHLEELMFVSASHIRTVMDKIIDAISRHHQKTRPGRSYARKTMQPDSKWRRC